MPVILGAGIPLFANGGGLETLQLIEGKVFPNSGVMCEFEPASEENEPAAAEPAED